MKAVFAAFCALLAPVIATQPIIKPFGVKVRPHTNPDLIGNGTFKQLVDHTDESKGTFSQRYWWDARSWKGPGSPVFVFNPGETAADDYLGYLENYTIPGLYADTFGGAVIIVEHRYWGESTPYKNLTAETMQYLNIMQAAYDMTYFANNVTLEFADSGGANADSAPWVLIGGSYSGALAAWTSQIDPGTYWAYHASSAVVEAIYNFWEYFSPVEQHLPRNCSADVRAVINYVDHVLSTGSKQDVLDLKTLFGLEMVEHNDDFAEQITTPVWQWQNSQATVLKFCDYVETYASDGAVLASDEGGVGLEPALKGYASYINLTVADSCRESSTNCSTYDDSIEWDDPEDYESGWRQWNWLLCDSPFAWWQTGPPVSDGGNIVSSFLTPEHFQRQCPLLFPATDGFADGSSLGFTTEHLNQYTGGWDADFDHVLFCGGERDPWLYATPSSPSRPGGPRNSTADTPIFMIASGAHVPDLTIDDIEDEMDVIEAEVKVMKGWLEEYSAKRK
ncbi:Serine carboxypeptidase S28 [Pleurostoma richardsiae]|uniref:Serine carboxypeptidase S28 n=1 Tax=Pleurostoma richardsiae TaxID=41990 RepID=A0AA38R5E4_9PEZI|nr:Serine carboxypeptidase S28 [Pleurostoma richardsiae]